VYRAFGKVNLTLSVLGRRQDGYHEVSTLMAPVGIADVLTFSRRQKGLSLTCPGLPDLPADRNLAFRASRAILDASGEPFGLDIHIEKNIPPGSGMGGGSSDAATALLAVNGMLPPETRFDLRALSRAAAGLGVDIPFFLGCDSDPPEWQAALCTGTGEEVEPVDGARLHAFSLVIAFPMFQVSTALAYADWDEDRPASGGEAGRRAEATAMSALISGDPERLAGALANDLEGPVSRRYPQVLVTKRRLVECGALGASMTGSGSAVFGVCRSQEHAEAVRARMAEASPYLELRGAIVTKLGV